MIGEILKLCEENDWDACHNKHRNYLIIGFPKNKDNLEHEAFLDFRGHGFACLRTDDYFDHDDVEHFDRLEDLNSVDVSVVISWLKQAAKFAEGLV